MLLLLKSVAISLICLYTAERQARNKIGVLHFQAQIGTRTDRGAERDYPFSQ